MKSELYLEIYGGTGKDFKIRKQRDPICGVESSLPSSVPEGFRREEQGICHEISWKGTGSFSRRKGGEPTSQQGSREGDEEARSYLGRKLDRLKLPHL